MFQFVVLLVIFTTTITVHASWEMQTLKTNTIIPSQRLAVSSPHKESDFFSSPKLDWDMMFPTSGYFFRIFFFLFSENVVIKILTTYFYL